MEVLSHFCEVAGRELSPLGFTKPSTYRYQVVDAHWRWHGCKSGRCESRCCRFLDNDGMSQEANQRNKAIRGVGGPCWGRRRLFVKLQNVGEPSPLHFGKPSTKGKQVVEAH